MSHRDIATDDTDICWSFYHVQHYTGTAPAAPNCHCCLAGTGLYKYPLFWGFRSLKSLFLMISSFSCLLWHHTLLCFIYVALRHRCISSYHINVCVCVSRFKVPVVSLSGRLAFERVFRNLCLFVVWNPKLYHTCMYFSWLKFKSEFENERPSAKNLVRY